MRILILFFATQVYPNKYQTKTAEIFPCYRVHQGSFMTGVLLIPPLEPYTPTTACLYNEVGERSVLLSTAKVKVQSTAGGRVPMIAILDSGSQQCLCSFEAADVLRLKKDSCATIAGVNRNCFSHEKKN
ncbi:hypothetical protein TNCT_348111 [Trichonephila clavata]|uniref:Uncharacterized protein n=1 Tax=Trichonephila clavata TaxID=2740835 RepID=A0A8X6GEH3_TRICU|nr:hypothetical protein TNCT_348111 [Trichonephila clavata]